MNKIWFFLSLLVGLMSCQPRKKDSSNLPGSIGAPGQILAVLDSLNWIGGVGDSILSVLSPNISLLLEPEYLFNLRYIRPDGFMGILQRHHNVLIVLTFDIKSAHTDKLKSLFSPQTLNVAQKGDRILYQRNLFAQEQSVAIVLSKDSLAAARLISRESRQLQTFFLVGEEQRIDKRLFGKVAPNTKAMSQIRQNHGFSIRVPFNYELVKDTAGFVWLRYPTNLTDLDLLVCYRPYRSRAQFDNDSLIAWRNEICKAHIFVNKESDPNSFLTTETLVKPISEPATFAGSYARKIRGLWKANTSSLGGGPFTAISFVKGDRQYYLEGFVYAPGKPKREFIRELEAIMRTFD